MRRWAVALLTAVALTGCSSSDSAPGIDASSAVADCNLPVRYQDAIYFHGGISTQPGEPLGEAELGSCEDTGPNPRGATFADEPRMVPVLQFAGHDPRQVLGVQEPTFVRVMFAEDVPEDLRRQLGESGLVEPNIGTYGVAAGQD